MNIKIKGLSLESYIITIQDGDDERVYDIAKELIIDDNLDREIDYCAAREHFWNQVAAEAKEEFELFENIAYAKYRAWIEKYARHYMKGVTGKTAEPAKGHIEQAAILIFCKDGMTIDRSKYLQVAHKGYSDECIRIGIHPMGEKDFESDMYYDDNTFEIWEASYLGQKHKVQKLEVIARAFNTKSWSIKTKAADKRALIGANI